MKYTNNKISYYSENNRINEKRTNNITSYPPNYYNTRLDKMQDVRLSLNQGPYGNSYGNETPNKYKRLYDDSTTSTPINQLKQMNLRTSDSPAQNNLKNTKEKIRELINSPRIVKKEDFKPGSPKYLNKSKSETLLPPSLIRKSKKTLVLDLDETLVHSETRPISQKPDITLNVVLEGSPYTIYVLKRPGASEFIEKMSKCYELVLFTASYSQYADPVIDIIDRKRNISHRLYRENCDLINRSFVKDLNRLGRDLKDAIILDNNPVSFSLNINNGLPIRSWYDDKNDRDLYDLIPLLEGLSHVDDVRDHIKKFVYNNIIDISRGVTLLSKKEVKELNPNDSMGKGFGFDILSSQAQKRQPELIAKNTYDYNAKQNPYNFDSEIHYRTITASNDPNEGVGLLKYPETNDKKRQNEGKDDYKIGTGSRPTGVSQLGYSQDVCRNIPDYNSTPKLNKKYILEESNSRKRSPSREEYQPQTTNTQNYNSRIFGNPLRQTPTGYYRDEQREAGPLKYLSINLGGKEGGKEKEQEREKINYSSTYNDGFGYFNKRASSGNIGDFGKIRKSRSKSGKDGVGTGDNNYDYLDEEVNQIFNRYKNTREYIKKSSSPLALNNRGRKENYSLGPLIKANDYIEEERERERIKNFNYSPITFENKREYSGKSPNDTKVYTPYISVDVRPSTSKYKPLYELSNIVASNTYSNWKDDNKYTTFNSYYSTNTYGSKRLEYQKDNPDKNSYNDVRTQNQSSKIGFLSTKSGSGDPELFNMRYNRDSQEQRSRIYNSITGLSKNINDRPYSSSKTNTNPRNYERKDVYKQPNPKSMTVERKYISSNYGI